LAGVQPGSVGKGFQSYLWSWGGRDAIEEAARVLAERVNDLDVAAEGGGGVVATHQLVAQALQ
jgi:hypothetical protein